MSDGTALLIIDAQVNMFTQGYSVHSSETILRTLSALVARALSAGVPTVYVQNNGGRATPTK